MTDFNKIEALYFFFENINGKNIRIDIKLK